MKKKLLFTLAAVLVVAVIALSVFSLFFAVEYPLRYKEEILMYSDIYSVPGDLICAVINVESGYDPDAVSRAGAVGLMQILPATAGEIAQRLGVAEYDILDPETNIRFGTYYLSILYSMTSNWETALAAYNAGIGNVTGWLADPLYSPDGERLTFIPIAETAAYVKKVIKQQSVYAKKLSK